MRRGFTLIEMMLSVGIMSLLAALALPLYATFASRNNLAVTAQSLASMLRRAEVYARANYGDNQWGVNIQSSAVTLFQGTSYATRNSGLDETLTIPGGVSSSYSGDIVFSKLSGAPSTTATITMSSTAVSTTQTVSINAKGMVAD